MAQLGKNAGDKRDTVSIQVSGRYLGDENGNLFQYSCLENPMDRRAWRATYSPWGCKDLDMTELINYLADKIYSTEAKANSGISRTFITC